MPPKKGWKMPEETKAKLRASRLANNPMKGSHHTEEARAKMRASNNPSWNKGAASVGWKGGRTVDRKGYIQIYMPDHPNAVGNYVPEHRLVMEGVLGRLLSPSEDVHHINHVKDDNRPDNLMVVPHAVHFRDHHSKITPEQVKEIRELHAQGLTYAEIARRIRTVKHGAVRKVVVGISHKNIS